MCVPRRVCFNYTCCSVFSFHHLIIAWKITQCVKTVQTLSQIVAKVKWWNEMDYFSSFSVFGMFSSLSGIDNIDHMFSSMIKKCCLCQRWSHREHSEFRNARIWRQFIFDVLLLCVLWFSNVPFLDSSLIIGSATAIFQNIYSVNTTGSSSHSTGPGWCGLLIAVMGSQTLFQVNITLFT